MVKRAERDREDIQLQRIPGTGNSKCKESSKRKEGSVAEVA